MVKRTKPRKEPNSSAYNIVMAIIIFFGICDGCKKMKANQTIQLHTYLTHNFMSQSYSFPFVEFYHYISYDEKASYHWQKTACFHQYDLWKFNEILWQRMIWYIIYNTINNTKMRYVISKILTADCWCSGNSLLALPGELVGCEVSSSIIFVWFIGTCGYEVSFIN